MKYKLIVALDFNSEAQALELANILDPSLCALKVGSEMYTLFGPAFVSKLITRGYKVFLDLKFHDIPTTVAKSCLAAAELGVWMLNVHASGGETMLTAAQSALASQSGADRPLLIAVTVLTSMQTTDLNQIGVLGSLDSQVSNLVNLAKNSGLDGVVASGFEVPSIKELCGPNFIAVTPGIRGVSNQTDDQQRVMTPQKALSLGSDYLVIGRPITRAKDPLIAIEELFNDA